MTRSNDTYRYGSVLLFGGIAILLVCIAYAIFLPNFILKEKDLFPSLIDNGQLGIFGDFFGALNTFFAGLAFTGLIVTIRQQSADLRATKAEMRGQTQQFKLNRDADDMYRRIALIKDLENSIHLLLIHNRKEHLYQGESALFESCRKIRLLFISLFPDEEREAKLLFLDSISQDCIRFAIAFEYLDAWLKSYCALIDDLHDNIEDTPNEEKYLKTLLRATHSTKLSVIYTFHDNYSRHKNFDKLLENGILKDDEILPCLREKKKRELFFSMLIALLNAVNEDDNKHTAATIEIVRYYANEWRKYKGWSEFLPTAQFSASSPILDKGNYAYDIAEIVKDPKLTRKIISSIEVAITDRTANSSSEFTSLSEEQPS